MTDWHYGHIAGAWAFRLNDRLIVRVDGVKPDSAFGVRLREYVPDRESSADVQLGLYWKGRPGIHGDAATAYSARIDLDVGGMEVDVVRVDHADGHTDVQVRHVPFPSPAARPAGGGEYTGWSRTSFEEAYRHAVALIPLRGADDLVHARVVAQGGMHGGVAGLDDLFVTVQRADPAPDGAAPGIHAAPAPG